MLLNTLFLTVFVAVRQYDCKQCLDGLQVSGEVVDSTEAACQASCVNSLIQCASEFNNETGSCKTYDTCNETTLTNSDDCTTTTWIITATTEQPPAPLITVQHISLQFALITITADNTIYYEIGGGDPTPGDAQYLYTGEFSVSSDTVIKAVTVSKGVPSQVTSQLVVLQGVLYPPELRPVGIDITTETEVFLTTDTVGATILQRTCQGHLPQNSCECTTGTPMTSPSIKIPLSGKWTVSAMTVSDGLPSSDCVVVWYEVASQCPTPEVYPPTGRYITAVKGVVVGWKPTFRYSYHVVKQGETPSPGVVYNEATGFAIQGVGNYTVMVVAEDPGGVWLASEQMVLIYVVVDPPEELMVRIPVETNTGGGGVVHVEWYEQHIASTMNVPVERVVIEKVLKDNMSDSTVILKTSFRIASTVYEEEPASESLSSLFLALPDSTLRENNIEAVWVEGDPPPPTPSPSDDNHTDVVIIVLVVAAVSCVCCLVVWWYTVGRSEDKASETTEKREEEQPEEPQYGYGEYVPPPVVKEASPSESRKQSVDEKVVERECEAERTPTPPPKRKKSTTPNEVVLEVKPPPPTTHLAQPPPNPLSFTEPYTPAWSPSSHTPNSYYERGYQPGYAPASPGQTSPPSMAQLFMKI